VRFLQDERLLWFINRGTGSVLLVLLTASVALGVLSTVRTGSSRWPRFVTQALHRNISLIALALLVAHAGAAIIDDYVDIKLVDALVPFGAGYRSFWVGLGTLASDLLLLAAASSLARHRLSLRNWRAIHLSTYLAWPLGLSHGLGIGTDQRTTWSVVLTAICVGLVAGAGAIRLSTLSQERKLANLAVMTGPLS
jgi:methionine sulfoxide reductase heme-binding subunit